MYRRTLAAAVLLMFAAAANAADTKMTVKVEKTEPPKELSDAMRAVLSDQAMNVFDEKEKLVCTVWPAKKVDTKANADVSRGIRYSHLEETTVLGAVKFASEWKDYRKSKIKPGVYVIRLGIQLMDGDHMGTSPYNEFALLCPAAEDKKPNLMELKALYELSSMSTTRRHPGIMLLFPNRMPADAPAMEAKPKQHTVLSYRVPATAGKEKATLGFSLVVVGETMAE